jgi:U32 family peptidase
MENRSVSITVAEKNMIEKQNNTIKKIPELLAPAGSIESFHAAIDAGADAVYMGLSDFNARMRAKNFTVKTLSYLLPYAHSRNVKVYITLNTLVKQEELTPLVNFLYQLEQLRVDALIVTDPGVIAIARTHFPSLSLHASTQMAVHNSAGTEAVFRMGIKRAILARELSLEEIRTICAKSRLELEVFVHGALCYSISGMCLASSFLGGASGNRGRCTQVCRRKFTRSDSRASGYFFSPCDLCAIGSIPEYIRIGISSLKIEGRMKGPEYVSQVVKAYRAALDNTENTGLIAESLENDLGRKKTRFFLDGERETGIIDSSTPGTGVYIGVVKETEGMKILLSGKGDLIEGDRVRIQPSNGFEGVPAVISGCVYNGSSDLLTITCRDSVTCAKGDQVYLVSRHKSSLLHGKPRETGVRPLAYREKYPFIRRILRECEPVRETGGRRERLWFKIDSTGWLDLLRTTPCQKLICACDYEDLSSLLADTQRLHAWRSRLVLSLPPWIGESELDRWRAMISKADSLGLHSWACTNIGHTALFPEHGNKPLPRQFSSDKTKGFPSKADVLVADNPLWSMNTASQKELYRLGFNFFTSSTEDDYLNVKRTASTATVHYLYSHVPLFISRVKPDIETGVPLIDPRGNEFSVRTKHGLYYLLSKSPFSLTHKKEKLSGCGITDFIIDLCFCSPDEEFLAMLITAYKNGSKIENTSLFNFKAGLK